jgi:hypothetical protein
MRRRWCQVSFGCLSVIVFLLLLGCRLGEDGISDRLSDAALTPEVARRALIKLVEASDREELKMALLALRSDTITEVAADSIEIGRWRCNLKSKTFCVDVDAGSIFAEYCGVFSLTGDGQWQAKITSESHN